MSSGTLSMFYFAHVRQFVVSTILHKTVKICFVIQQDMLFLKALENVHKKQNVMFQCTLLSILDS